MPGDRPFDTSTSPECRAEARATWHSLDDGIDYQDLGGDWFKRNVNNDTPRQLHELGYRVTVEPVA